MDTFNIKKLNDVEQKERDRVKLLKKTEALGNLEDYIVTCISD
jgi:hypothetical protein